MKLMTLMDRRGDATAWVDRNSGWVSDRIGNIFALVSFDSVFNQMGAQIGWVVWRPHPGPLRSRRSGSTGHENVNVPRPKRLTTTPDVAFAIESSSAEMVANACLEKIPMGGG